MRKVWLSSMVLGHSPLALGPEFVGQPVILQSVLRVPTSRRSRRWAGVPEEILYDRMKDPP